MSARHLQRRDDPATLLENDDTDLRAVVRSVFRSQADEWLTERHPSLGGRSPQDCMNGVVVGGGGGGERGAAALTPVKSLPQTKWFSGRQHQPSPSCTQYGTYTQGTIAVLRPIFGSAAISYALFFR